MDSSLITKLRRKLNLEQMTSLCSGENNWETKSYEALGIPKVVMSDGPHGLRVEAEKEEGKIGVGDSLPATCFPPATLAACSFDESLIREMASAIAREARAAGVDLILGPGLNIKRSPLCGRNFEYYSEDPYLSGHLAKAFVEGARKEHTGATLKHFFGNNQETRRMTINALIDERALREIYLKGFEIAVKEAGPMAVMCSYNSVNGEFLSQNKHFLTEILRNEWGFEGIVMTDWGAVYDRVKGVKAGLDLEMPGSGGVNDKKIFDAIKEGKLKKTRLNEMAERLIAFALEAEENRQPAGTPEPVDINEQHLLARRIAAESMVLLKNEDSLLPLDREKLKTIAVIGKMAFDPRYQGSGSSKINPYRIEAPYDAIAAETEEKVKLLTAQGYSDSSDEKHRRIVKEAAETAGKADVAVVFAGLPDKLESEGYDRTSLKLPENQLEMIRRVCEEQPNTIVVLFNGGVVDLEFEDQPKAVLEAWLGGQAVGAAVSDIIFGRVNPSGRLAETIPMRLEDTPAYINFPGTEDSVNYGESIFVGYRYYDYVNRSVRYPFGFGLSYTTFEYSEMKASAADDGTVIASCRIKNTGARAGKEVIQLYTGKLDGKVQRPIRELKGFTKIDLEPGEEKVVAFELSKDDFTYFNPTRNAWTQEEGPHLVFIGASSRDIRLKAEIALPAPPLPKLTRYSYMDDFMANPRGRQVIEMIMSQFQSVTGKTIDTGDAFFMTMLHGTPVSKIVTFTNGLLSDKSVDRILEFVNGEDASETFDIRCLFEDKEEKKNWFQSMLEGIFGKKEDNAFYTVDCPVRDLMANPETRAVLAKYCPDEYMNGEIMDMIISMGVTMRKVQKLIPDEYYPYSLLTTIDEELRLIPKDNKEEI